MSLVIGDNFSYQGRNPLDSRMLFDTIADMKNYNENYLPDITLAFNKEDGKMYVFNRTNDVDEDTGKWREFEGGESGTDDYDDLLNKPLEKQQVTETKYMFYRMSDMLYNVYSLELETGATLYNTETGNPTSWTLYIDGDTYKIDSASGGELTYTGEHTEVIGTQVVVNDPYKDAFRVENLTNVKINDNLKDGDVFTFRDEGQSLYAWQPLEGEPFYSEKEIPEEGDVVYESTGGVISKLPIDSYRWTTDHQAQEGSAFIRQASNPTPYYDIQVGRYPQSDIIKEKYWTNAEASGDSIQVSELPTATSENVGKVYQYIGDDTQDYKHNFFYENKYTEGEPGYYAFTLGDVEVYYATSETPSNGDPIYSIYEGEIQQIPLEIGYWVVDAESPSGYSLYAVEGGGQTMPTTRDSTQDIPGEPGGYQRVSVEVQEGDYDTLKNKPVFVGATTQPGYGWTVEYEIGGGQTETRDFLTLVDELPENGTIQAYDIENDERFELLMLDGLAYGEDTVTRNSSIDQDVTATTKEVNEKYYDIIGITELPTPSSEYVGGIYRYVGGDAFRQNPSGDYIYFNKHDLVICQEIDDSYYWTKYGMTPELTSLPTDWEGGYGQTNNYYNDGAKTIVSYNDGKLYAGTVNWSTFQWNWEEAKFGKEYSAGAGIKIYDEYSDFSAIQGPCENGFHIPQSSEWTALQNAITTPTQLETLLHLPFAGCLQNSGNPIYSGTNHYYWNSTVSSQAGYAEHLYSWSQSDAYYPTNNSWRKYAMPIRAFKDVPVIPDNTWNQTLTNKVWEKNGLISILVDTNKYVTVKDKNEGATVVYNHGDALTDANCGKCFQRGNNYAFSLNGETVIASTVNTTGYSRENPYSSSEFHYPSGNDWSNPSNDELWGATTGVRELTDAIVNTGVLSVNGKKGKVTLDFPQSLSELSDTQITSASSGDVLVRGSSKWENKKLKVADLEDIDTTILEDKDLLRYNATNQVYETVPDYTAGKNIAIDTNTGYEPRNIIVGEGYNIGIRPRTGGNIPNTILYLFNSAGYFSGREAMEYLYMPKGQFMEYTGVLSSSDSASYFGGAYVSSNGTISRVMGLGVDDTTSMVRLRNESYQGTGYLIRAFKNEVVKPDNSGDWSHTLTDSVRSVYTRNVWYNATLGLITVHVVNTNGTVDKWITMKDKNEGATTVYHRGDTETAANVGNIYQYGNIHGFDDFSEPTNKSSTAVDISGYARGTYDSDTWITLQQPYSAGGGFIWGQNVQLERTRVIRNTLEDLEQLDNVEITNVQDKDVLKFSSSSHKWHNEQPITYSAGTGISFTSETTYDYSAIKGPCSEGFHVMTIKEAGHLEDALGYVFHFDEISGQQYLKMPTDGFLSGNRETGKISGGSGSGDAYIWVNAFADPTATGDTTRTSRLKMDYQDGISLSAYGHKGDGVHIRPIKDEYVEPDSSWTTLYSNGDNGIYHNATLGLISIKCVDSEQTYYDRSSQYPDIDWSGTVNVHITMSDKNLGATQVRDPNDSEITDANGGLYYQWGNNFGFSHDREGTDYDSSTAISTTGYAPSTFSNNEFIYIDDAGNGGDWSIEHNPDLWGGVTGVVEVPGYDQTITNTITTLGALTDVNINNVQDGDIIAYNAASLKYKNIKNDPYIAGEGISLEPTTKTVTDYSAMRGPCPEGFHVPSDLGNISSIINSISDYKKLHMPTNCGYWAGSWQNRNNPESGWTDLYWQTDPGYYAGEGCAWHFDEYNSNRCGSTDASATYGLPIRAFKDEVVLPDSTWTEELAGKIWHNTALGLITYFDGTDYYTMADKNVGATQVWNDGDPCTDANVGLYFQQGNNYGYHYGDTVPTTDELIDVSSVEPSTYSSATWGSADHSSRWDEVNADIWGEETKSQQKTITKTGIQNLSMNESDVAFATVTLTGTTATLSDAFITAETFVDYIVKNGTPAGTITITVANGSLTLSSTASENLILLLRLEKVNSKSVILN